jgi:hypothetical protein
VIAYHGCSNRCQIWAGSRKPRREGTGIEIKFGRISDVAGMNALAAVAHATVSRSVNDGNTLETKLHILLALSVLVEEGECVLSESIRHRNDVSRLVRSAHFWLVPGTVGKSSGVGWVRSRVGIPGESQQLADKSECTTNGRSNKQGQNAEMVC